MRRVIQRTITTTKIISLTITHSESEEAVEYALVEGAAQAGGPLALDEFALDDEAPGRPAPDIAPTEPPLDRPPAQPGNPST